MVHPNDMRLISFMNCVSFKPCWRCHGSVVVGDSSEGVGHFSYGQSDE